MKTKKSICLRLPEVLINDLKIRASEEGITVTELVTRLIKKGLRENQDNSWDKNSKKINILESEVNELKNIKDYIQKIQDQLIRVDTKTDVLKSIIEKSS